VHFKNDARGLNFKIKINNNFKTRYLLIIGEQGVQVNLHDPQALKNAKKLFVNAVNYFEDMYDAMKDCDAITILTEWHVYRNLDLEKANSLLKHKIILDTRNVLDPQTCHQAGFLYEGVGRR